MENESTNLEIIKKLIILDLLHKGVGVEDIGQVLGVSGRRVRQMMPSTKGLKKTVT